MPVRLFAFQWDDSEYTFEQESNGENSSRCHKAESHDGLFLDRPFQIMTAGHDQDYIGVDAQNLVPIHNLESLQRVHLVARDLIPELRRIKNLHKSA